MTQTLDQDPDWIRFPHHDLCGGLSALGSGQGQDPPSPSADPGNTVLLRNYLTRLEMDPRPAPPECRNTEAQYLAAVWLHQRGILTAAGSHPLKRDKV